MGCGSSASAVAVNNTVPPSNPQSTAPQHNQPPPPETKNDSVSNPQGSPNFKQPDKQATSVSPQPPRQQSPQQQQQPINSTSTSPQAPTVQAIENEVGLLEKMVIDEKMALGQVSGDKKLLVELYGMLEEQYRKDYPEMVSCMPHEEWNKLWKAAHSMKGAAANLGVQRVSTCCQKIEFLGKELEKLVQNNQPVPEEQKLRMLTLFKMIEKHWAEYTEKLNDFKSKA